MSNTKNHAISTILEELAWREDGNGTVIVNDVAAHTPAHAV